MRVCGCACVWRCALASCLCLDLFNGSPRPAMRGRPREGEHDTIVLAERNFREASRDVPLHRVGQRVGHRRCGTLCFDGWLTRQSVMCVRATQLRSTEGVLIW